MKFAICNEIFHGWKLEEAMAFAKKVGYDGIEIAPFTIANDVRKISAAERGRIREMAGRTGIEIAGIHWVLVQTEGFHLTHMDPAVRQRTSEYFSELVDFCSDIGGKTIVVGSPKQRNLLEGVSSEQGWDFATDIFRESVRRAEERAVTICLEPLAPSETNFINTADEAVRFTRLFNTPHFQTVLDVKAMCSETEDGAQSIPQIIRKSWPHFCHFHANDRNLKGPGFGDVDFTPIAAALREVGYTGYVSVEVFKFDEGAEQIATKSIDYLKRAFARQL